MAERNWTAGPWVVEKDRAGDYRVIAETNPTKEGRDMGARWVIADSVLVFLYPEEQLKHAHLIAAAPELFEALEACVASLVDSGRDHAPSVEQARAALAKAKGEQV